MEVLNKLDFVWEHVIKDNLDNNRVDNQRQQPVVIWGSGSIGKSLYHLLKSLDIQVESFIDMDQKKWHTFFDGINILNPIQYLEQHPNRIVLVAIGAEAKIIKEQFKPACKVLYTPIEYLLKMVKNTKGERLLNILEIGPLNNPLFIGQSVKYFDVLSSEELRKKAISWGYEAAGVPEKINYISPTGDLSIIQDKFSYIYSAHVIEHQPDLINHLQKVENILADDGEYILVIPDKQYCFDYYKKKSTIIDVLLAHEKKSKVHTLQSFLYNLYSTHNDTVRHWRGDHGQLPRFTLNDFENKIKEYENSKGRYIDCHAWFFTAESIQLIFEYLFEIGLIHMKIKKIYSTVKNGQEFFCVLKKFND